MIGTSIVALVLIGGSSFNLIRTGSILPSGNGRVVTVDGSYTFDVHNLEALMAEAEEVFVAHVDTKDGTDYQSGSTTYRVTVQDVVKGDPPQHLLIEQHGFVDRDGTTYVSEEQPMLEVGKTYLISTNADISGAPNFVNPGPLAVRQITSQQQHIELTNKYRDKADSY